MLLSTKSFAALLAASFALSTACAGADAGEVAAALSATSTPGTPTVATAPAAPEAPLDLCTLVPVADVARILAETSGATVVASQKSAGGGCSYRDVQQGAPNVKLLLDFTAFGSPADAKGALDAARRMYAERSLTVQPIAALGDEAFATPGGATAGIKLRRGRYVGQVNLTGDELDPARAREAARKLAALVVERLP